MAKKEVGPHHVTVDGIPVCSSELLKDVGLACQVEDSHAAIRLAKKVKRALREKQEEANVQVVKGRCPRPNYDPDRYDH